MKLKTIIIDDEPLALRLMESYVLKTPFLELVASFNSAIEAMDSEILSTADIIFLDIQMPSLSGLEFSKIVPPTTRIIFTTAFSQYALDSYKVNALDYLLKPISYIDFVSSANKALQWFKLRDSKGIEEKNELNCIFVRSEYKLVCIEFNKLIYIEVQKDYIKFYVEDEKNPIQALMSMSTIEDLLPKSQFIRVHRSYIIRKDKIRLIERSRIVFGDVYIPISDSYKELVKSALKIGKL